MLSYDVFICHASEDKDDFVRPLAERLRAEHLEVWYDEFSLKLGDSLRRTIDLGLARSRYGVVVVSASFMKKQWAQRELDGLVARAMASSTAIVLPVWHGVTLQQVLEFSPPLADVRAADSSAGLDHVVSEICRTVRPAGSPLVIARDILIDAGLTPPVVTDGWWLDIVEATNQQAAYGMVLNRPVWGRWSFPLPPESKDPDERGERIAFTALQLAWCEAADRELISQITPPTEVLSFIERQPGLADACHDHPAFLATYAPQLTIPGLGGDFEEDFDAVATRVKAKGHGYPDFLALRDPQVSMDDFGGPTCQFFQGDISGPRPKLYELIDYTAWLLSDKSLWLPPWVRSLLTEGMKLWGVWWHDADRLGVLEELGFELDEDEELALAIAFADLRDGKHVQLSADAWNQLVRRLSFSALGLKLPERGETLADRLRSAGFLEPPRRDGR